MNIINKYSIHDRVEYIQDMFVLSDRFPTAFECFVLPLAAYDAEGKMVRANKIFRRLTGITEDDISCGRANLFKYLNEKNKGIIGAAKKAFDDEEVILQDLIYPMCSAARGEEKELSLFKNAVFFPLAYDRECITYSGVLFMRVERKTQGEDAQRLAGQT
jgi:hypothetical protein